MEKREFSLQQAATILRLPEKKIERLADAGELDGQKMQGKWLFSKADLMVWFAKHLGAEANAGHFDSMEEFAERHVPQEDSHEVTVAGSLVPESILLPFSAKTKDSVIREFARAAAEAGKIWDPERLADALRRREEMMSTAMENGVAILHPRRPMPDNLADSFLMLGIAPRGVPFGGGFANLTDVFFLVCACDDQSHLRLLAGIGRLLKQNDFLSTLRALDSSSAILDWIRANEVSR